MSRNLDLLVVETAEEAAEEVAARLAAVAGAGGRLVLTGGSTPKRAYELAAGRQRDWSGAHVWWSDERCVPPDDERSNYGMTRAMLLDRLAAPPDAHRIRGELAAADAAAEYDREILGTAFDFVLLGIGPDGHTASLFPHAPTLDERERAAVPAEAGLEPFVPRVTLTIPALERARIVVFLVTGLGKADAVARAFGGEHDAGTPASLVRSEAGETIAVLDREAASRLS